MTKGHGGPQRELGSRATMLSTHRGDDLRMLVPRAVAQRLTRRRLLRLGGNGALALGFGAALAGCGTSEEPDTPAAADAAGGDGSGGGGGGGGGSDDLNIYTWAEYTDPATVDAYTADSGVNVTLDVYDSNEAAIARLELAGGSSGYDLICPTGTFIPLMSERGLLAELDKSQIPNFENLDPAFLDQIWDPGNTYSVTKDWGATGFVYDTSVITEEITDYAGFFRAAAQEGVSGNVSVLDVPGSLAGMYFWREGIDWITTDTADLDAAEQALLAELAPHLRAFDSYPTTAMLEGSYVLSQAWNGDARTAVNEDPERYRWVLPGPLTEVWQDTWAVLATAANPEAAHAFINHVLDPEISAQEINFHGYNTAVVGTEEFLGEDVEGREIIFFSEEETARLVAGEVNEAQDRLVQILDNVKAAAGLA